LSSTFFKADVHPASRLEHLHPTLHAVRASTIEVPLSHKVPHLTLRIGRILSLIRCGGDMAIPQQNSVPRAADGNAPSATGDTTGEAPLGTGDTWDEEHLENALKTLKEMHIQVVLPLISLSVCN